MKKTKIICTIGPSSMSKEVLQKLHKAGMNACRINTAHGDFEQYKTIIKTVRSIAPLPIILDIKGPEVRLQMQRSLPNYNQLPIKKGSKIEVGDPKSKMSLSFSCSILKKLKPGDHVCFNDGNLQTVVESKRNKHVVLRAKNDFILRDGVGVNVINKSLNLPSLSKKDYAAISFAKKNKIEYIALSFCRNKKDVLSLRRKLAGTAINIIAKIENFEGVENIDEIIKYSDGIMVARGDLGIELPSERVPLIQKDILAKCSEQGKPDIVATQMLKSMVASNHPTRAETSDVANAILDGADSVMLSEETAMGAFPVESVTEISKIAREVEPRIDRHVELHTSSHVSDSISFAVYEMCRSLNVDKIVTLTVSSYTTRMIARFRPTIPIIAVTNNPVVRNQMELHFGVIPVLIDKRPRQDEILHTALACYKKGLLKKNDRVIFAAKLFTSKPKISNVLQVHKMKELLEHYQKRK